jgi:hypothetical protein
MPQLGPIEILEELTRQMREDAAVEGEMQAIAAMSDAELDAELRSYELDPAQLETQALAIHEAGGPPAAAIGRPVKAVPLHAPRPLAEGSRRRRPVAVAVWIAAAAAAAATTGGLIYTWMHPPQEQPLPAPPAPSPSTMPAPSVPPDLVAFTPADLRKNAADALERGQAGLCLRLLDDAKQADPAGDATPEVTALRTRALDALSGKKR